jgi:nuclease-like protein
MVSWSWRCNNGTVRRRRGSYPRRQFRRQRFHFLRRNWLVVVGFVAICSAVAIMLSRVLSGYFLGAAHGALAVFMVSAVGLVFLLTSGASRQLAGAYGEDNTSDVLRAAQRRRHIWGWIDNLEVQGGDVDHLVFAPSGIHALDSKWHSSRLDDTTLPTDVAAAQRMARRARLILRSLRYPHLEVRPAVVVWGHASEVLTAHSRTVDGVEIIGGRALLLWLSQQPTKQLSKEQAQQVLRSLHEFKARVVPSDPDQA